MEYVLNERDLPDPVVKVLANEIQKYVWSDKGIEYKTKVEHRGNIYNIETGRNYRTIYVKNRFESTWVHVDTLMNEKITRILYSPNELINFEGESYVLDSTRRKMRKFQSDECMDEAIIRRFKAHQSASLREEL